MFILREVSQSGVRNISLGDEYTFIDKYSKDKDRFEAHYFDSENCREGAQDSVFGLVSVSLSDAIPLYWTNEYYVMTQDGATFERLDSSNSLKSIMMRDSINGEPLEKTDRLMEIMEEEENDSSREGKS